MTAVNPSYHGVDNSRNGSVEIDSSTAGILKKYGIAINANPPDSNKNINNTKPHNTQPPDPIPINHSENGHPFPPGHAQRCADEEHKSHSRGGNCQPNGGCRGSCGIPSELENIQSQATGQHSGTIVGEGVDYHNNYGGDRQQYASAPGSF